MASGFLLSRNNNADLCFFFGLVFMVWDGVFWFID
jgi:hypothetical protein